AVVWKPATETPLMAHEMAHIFTEAGLPDGVMNVVFGAGAEVGDAMIQHPNIQVISFTGSTETGKHVASECGKQLKKVSLELGGKNAVIVMDDADIDLSVEGILWRDRKSTRLNSSHVSISYAVFCLKKKKI